MGLACHKIYVNEKFVLMMQGSCMPYESRGADLRTLSRVQHTKLSSQEYKRVLLTLNVGVLI